MSNRLTILAGTGQYSLIPANGCTQSAEWETCTELAETGQWLYVIRWMRNRRTGLADSSRWLYTILSTKWNWTSASWEQDSGSLKIFWHLWTTTMYTSLWYEYFWILSENVITLTSSTKTMAIGWLHTWRSSSWMTLWSFLPPDNPLSSYQWNSPVCNKGGQRSEPHDVLGVFD